MARARASSTIRASPVGMALACSLGRGRPVRRPPAAGPTVATANEPGPVGSSVRHAVDGGDALLDPGEASVSRGATATT